MTTKNSYIIWISDEILRVPTLRKRPRDINAESRNQKLGDQKQSRIRFRVWIKSFQVTRLEPELQDK